MKFLTSKLLWIALLLPGVIAQPALAQSYPARNITFNWPFNVGTPNGEAFRVLAEEAGRILGHGSTP